MVTHRTVRRALSALALTLSFAALAGAQTTGGLAGRVADETGGVLPGVTVTAASAALQGTRSAITDETGSYRIALLPPGSYSVAFELSGFATERSEGVAVALGLVDAAGLGRRAAALRGEAVGRRGGAVRGCG